MQFPRIDADTTVQIEALILGQRPLVLCDVDEVVVHFVTALERHLERNGYWLHARSFALTGNIKRAGTDVAASQEEVDGLIHTFFAEEAAGLSLVPGAADALSAIAGLADIVMLTNLPGAFRQARIDNLRGHGLDYPVITNVGPKGPAAAAIASRSPRPVVFIDDAPSNIRSVAGAVPDAHIVHFVFDPRFDALLEPIDGVHLRTGLWSEALVFIGDTMAGAAERP